MRKSFRFMLPFVLSEKKYLFMGFSATFLAAYFTWLGPQLLARLIDGGFVKLLLLAFAGSEFLKLLLNYLNQKVFATFGQNVIERIRESMLKHLMKVPVSYFDRSTSGQIMTRFVNDANSLSDFFQSGMISIVGNAFSIFAIFFGIHSLSSKLAIVMLIIFIPFFYTCSVFSKRLRLAYESSRNELSHFNSMLADFLHGMKTIRSLSLSGSKNRALNRQIQKYSDSQVQMVHEFALFNPVLSLGVGVLFFVLILQGIPMVDRGELKTGEWIAILSYIFMLSQPLLEITDRWNFFLAGLTGIDRIRSVFDEPIEKTGKNEPSEMEEIVLDGVSFRYPGATKDVLKDVNLRIVPGDRIGIHGESGMGKTTLLQMLYGFYLPTRGDLRWNGVRYHSYSIESIRRYFGVVEQFPFLFSGTIHENITLFGKNENDFHRLKEQFADYPLILSVLNRAEEEVRERGANLSMGEKQMISFLRAYLKNPQIWILDEATAFFDQQAEDEFMRALDSLSHKIIIIQIAHRKEALTRMKRLIKVESQGLQQLST